MWSRNVASCRAMAAITERDWAVMLVGSAFATTTSSTYASTTPSSMHTPSETRPHGIPSILEFGEQQARQSSQPHHPARLSCTRRSPLCLTDNTAGLIQLAFLISLFSVVSFLAPGVVDRCPLQVRLVSARSILMSLRLAH